jgi:hypothetical protein
MPKVKYMKKYHIKVRYLHQIYEELEHFFLFLQFVDHDRTVPNLKQSKFITQIQEIKG